MNFSGMLLDSDVLAEIRKANPDPAVVAFLRRRSFRHMYISVLSIGELKGLYPYPETDRWIAELLERFGDHVINVDARVSLEWAGRQAPRGQHAVGRDDAERVHTSRGTVRKTEYDAPADAETSAGPGGVPSPGSAAR